MAKFSCFQDFVAFRFSGKSPRGEAIYQSMVAAETGAFDLTPGTYEEARIYAQSMGLARARYALERAQNQTDPLKAIELLPQLEHDWGVVPKETDGIVRRQRRLAAAFLLAQGALQQAMEAGLRAILGSDFLALLPMDLSLATIDESLALFTDPALPFKLVRISPVTSTGIPYTVDYVNADVTSAELFIDVDDKLVIEPENSGLREIVTVTAADQKNKTFTAIFSNPHDEDSFATTQNWVAWTSTKRSFYVVAKDASAVDAEARRLVDEYMTKVCPGITTWAIVEPSSPGAGTTGPFTLDSSPLGATTIASTTFGTPFSFADLPLTGAWFSENFIYNSGTPDSSSWVSSPSLGASGGRLLFPGTGQCPTVGSILAGFPGVHFTSASSDNMNGDLALTYISPGAWFVAVVAMVTSEPANSGSAWANGALVADASVGNFSLSVKSSNPTLQAYQSDGIADRVSTRDFTNGVPTLFMGRYDGTDIQAYVNGTWGTPVAAGIVPSAGTLRIGRGWSGLTPTCDIYMILISNVPFSDAIAEKIRLAASTKYGLPF